MAKPIFLIPPDVSKIIALPDVDVGDFNLGIVEVQRFLIRYGYLSAEAPLSAGTFDPLTSLAVSNFQARFQLSERGIIGPETRYTMSRPRCSLPDADPLGAQSTGPWPRRALSFSFGRMSRQVAAAVAQDAIRNAFRTWEAAGAGLVFTETETQECDISVEWREAGDPDHDMRGTLVAHSDLPPGYSLFTAAPPIPVHFDDDEHAWGVGSIPSTYDIESVALHEIGHSIGLLHSIAGSVMDPLQMPNRTLRELAADDIANLRILYP